MAQLTKVARSREEGKDEKAKVRGRVTEKGDILKATHNREQKLVTAKTRPDTRPGISREWSPLVDFLIDLPEQRTDRQR